MYFKVKKFLLPTIVLVAVATSAVFSNCSQDTVGFSSLGDSLTSTPSVEASVGTGEGYLGKPGEYVRTFPGYKCVNDAAGTMGALTFASMATITSDQCSPKNFQFDPTSPILDYAIYNPDYLGVGYAIYEIKSVTQQELPVNEVWCRHETANDGMDIAIKVSNDLSQSQAKLYLGNKINGLWQSKAVPLIAVSRSAATSNLLYIGNGLRLQVPKPSGPQMVTGNLRAIVDNTTYNVDLDCRVAMNNPIEDMGTGLTQQYTFNSLLPVNFQESLCANNSVLACENFEARTLVSDPANLPANYKNGGWAFQQPINNSSVATGNSLDGTKSLEYFIPTNNTGAGTSGFNFGSQAEVYLRFYMKLSSNFVYSSIATNFVLIWGTSNSVSFGVDGLGTPQLVLAGGSQGGTSILSNAGAFTSKDQWKCIEMHIAAGSGNTGAMELWVDSAKVGSLTNLDIQGTFSDFSHYINWSCVGGTNNVPTCDDSTNSLNLHPSQYIYFDNYIVAQQRIGCF